MRFLAALALSSLIPTVALADAAVAAVDDEPTSHDAVARDAVARDVTRAPVARAANRHAPSDIGELRAVRIDAPMPAAVDDRAPVAREHAVAPAHAVASTATDDDVVAELAAHQMKRHQRALDGCLAAARKRAPAAVGTMTLDFDVADRKVKSVHVSENGVHDPELEKCLTTTARAFTFSLATARFRWPVALQP